MVQVNYDGLFNRHRGMRLTFQCLLLLVFLDPAFSKFLNKIAKKGMSIGRGALPPPSAIFRHAIKKWDLLLFSVLSSLIRWELSQGKNQ